MTPEEELRRAEKARQILEDVEVKAALDDIGERIIEEWRRTAVKDAEMREKLWMMFNMLHNFKDRFKEHIETGKMASMQLREKGIFNLRGER